MIEPTGTVNVRYMVDDVEEAVAFYTKVLDFEVLNNFAPAFADVVRGNLRLLLSGPTSSAGRPMPDGPKPGPGGWNRIELVVDDIGADRLSAADLKFINAIVTGPGGSQILLKGPSGNPVASFRTGTGPEGRHRRSGPLGGQGGGPALSGAWPPSACRQSCSQRPPASNQPQPSTVAPALPEVHEKTPAGGLSPLGFVQLDPP